VSKIPPGWFLTKLGELSEYVTSGSRDWSKYYASSGALFVRTQDINTNRLAQLDKIARVTLPTKVEGKRTLIQKGDILITITGANVGKCARIVEEIPEAYVSQSVALVRLQDPAAGAFIHFQLIAPGDEPEKTMLQQSAYGMGRPVLSLPNVRDVSIKLAPMAEQERIVGKLQFLFKRLDGCRDRLDRVPQILKRFREAVLEAAVSGRLTEEWRGTAELTGWETKRAADICAKVQSGGTPKAGFVERAGVPFLKVYNIVDQKVAFDYRPQYVPNETDEGELRKSQTLPGDVLMNIVGPPLNKVAIVPSTFPNWNINQAITLFRPGPDISTEWLYAVLCEGRNVAAVMHETKGSVGQVNISLSQCRDFEIPVPPPLEQPEIVRRVGELLSLAEELERRYTEAAARVEKLTPSVLAKAFRGELVPQDPSDEPAEQLLRRIREVKDSEEKSSGKSKGGRRGAARR
jgi:type I restriction enzyme, S subunit